MWLKEITTNQVYYTNGPLNTDTKEWNFDRDRFGSSVMYVFPLTDNICFPVQEYSFPDYIKISENEVRSTLEKILDERFYKCTDGTYWDPRLENGTPVRHLGDASFMYGGENSNMTPEKRNQIIQEEIEYQLNERFKQ